jgi:hypothetical protein
MVDYFTLSARCSLDVAAKAEALAFVRYFEFGQPKADAE